MILDPRFAQLASVLTGYCVALRRGEHVLIEAFDIPDAMVVAVVRAACARRAHPHVQLHRTRVTRELTELAGPDAWALRADLELQRMRRMDAYIGLRGAENIFEQSDLAEEKVRRVTGLLRPVLTRRVDRTKWIITRWPSPSMAQQAGLSTEAFEDFFFRVCTLDYRVFTPGMRALAALMRSTDRVKITGPGTDLSFSLKGIGARICNGTRNLPDGEVYSCPVKDSVEGNVQYNARSVYLGVPFEDVRLEFRRGRIVNATANHSDRLNAILDSDPGARYIGEFALGFNPLIREPMGDILFDEKIAGSFHFTPGRAYAGVDNGNRSQVHWDLVCIQRPEYGGGEIWFDGKLIRKDGRFVPPALRSLNSPHQKA